MKNVNVDPVILAQNIIDAIQREEQNDEIKSLIEKADQYLLEENRDKPFFFEAFIKKTISDLRTTVNGCIKSRNNEKKKDDLKKYKEGYVNEIVQNANDVVWKVSDIQNPAIEFEFDKDNDKYTLICSYPDKGFNLENIYGFCTRGNSDKKAENGQEGMYGIGIKSLLCFVDELHIFSNIQIDITSSEKMLDTISIKKADYREGNVTRLSFCFTKNGKHAGFNTEKLVKFIDWIVGDERKDDEKLKYLFNGKDEEIVFDVRALFFTELRGKNRCLNNSIKKIIFRKCNDKDRDVVIETVETNVETNMLDESEKRSAKIVEILGKKYIIFHFVNEQISIAYEYNKVDDKLLDRLYSTYFIGSNISPMLGVNLGCLINTTAINSSRSGLERENEKEPEILFHIKNKGKETIRILCQLINQDKNKDNIAIYTDILCQLLYSYRFQGEEFQEKEEANSSSIFEEIAKSMPNWVLNDKKYVLYKEDGIEEKKIYKNRPPESDEANTKELYQAYKRYFYYLSPKTDTTDIIKYGDDEYKGLTNGIKLLCQFTFEDTIDTWLCNLSFPFFKEISDLIKKRIGGNDFDTIMSFLSDVDEEDKKNVKQLIARYKVAAFFNYMGNYSSESIGVWMLDSGNESYDDDYQKQCEQFINDYGKLKELITDKITETSYYWSNNGNASSDWWYEWYKYKEWSNEFFPEEPENNYENQIIMLLELICKGYLFVGYNDDSKVQFITNILNKNNFNVILHNRIRQTTNWNGKFRHFSIDLLNRCMETFSGFKKARKYLDEYNIKKWKENTYAEDYKKLFLISYPDTCIIHTIDYAELEPVFKWLAVYEKIDSIKFKLGEIKSLPKESHESDVITFIKKFVGEDVHICFNKFKVENKGKHFFGFITNLKSEKAKIYIKQSKDSKLVSWDYEGDKSNQEKYLIVYSNVDDEQRILADILKELDYGDEICQYIHNYIQTGNTLELSSGDYNKYISQKRISYDYPFEYEECISEELDNNLSIDQIYTILAGEMSYNGHCPFCNLIPTLNIKENDLTSLEKRNTLIAMLTADYNGKDIYIKILCCKSCFEQYKYTLKSAEVKEGQNGIKILKLTQIVSDSARSRNLFTEIKISPDNWRIIELFN